MNLYQLLSQRWGDPNYPSEWDGREGGGKGSQRFWEYLWTLNQIGLPSSVIDAGCGKGQFFATLLRDGGIHTASIDPELDGETLEVFVTRKTRKADWITCISVLEHIENKVVFCAALDSLNAPIALTCELGDGCILMAELYKCLSAFRNHHITRMESCPVVADNSFNGMWRPIGIVLKLNE